MAGKKAAGRDDSLVVKLVLQKGCQMVLGEVKMWVDCGFVLQ